MAGELTRGITFAANETITNSKLHNLIDQTSVNYTLISGQTSASLTAASEVILNKSNALVKANMIVVSDFVGSSIATIPSVTGIIGSTQILQNSISFNRLPQIAGSSLLGNQAGTTGDFSGVPLGTGLAFSAGSVIVPLGTGLSFATGSVALSSNLTSKAWARVLVNSGASIAVGQNVGSVSYHGYGTTCLYFTNAFANGTSYGGNVSITTTGLFTESSIPTLTAGSAVIVTRNTSDVGTDAPYFASFYGL